MSAGQAAPRASWGAATDRGRVRRANEDAFLAVPPVFVVADGMGGHDSGELASRAAVEALLPLVGQVVATSDVVALVRDADVRVRAIAHRPGFPAGTTVSGVVLAVQDGVEYAMVLNLGDSRTYRVHDGALVQVSVDHSEVQERVDAGELTPAQAQDHPRRNVITRALGAGPGPEPDVWLLPAAEVGRVLVCSDGLTGEVGDPAIADLLAVHPDPQDAADALVRAALAAGGRDNVTVLVVDLAGAPVVEDVTQPRPRTAAAAGADPVLHAGRHRGED